MTCVELDFIVNFGLCLSCIAREHFDLQKLSKHRMGCEDAAEVRAFASH